MNLYNPYLFAPLIAWLVSQLVKFVISLKKGRPNLRLFYQSGGMPSAHSAAVCALAACTLILSGYNSALFGVAALIAAIVTYDSFGVRKASGDQAVIINSILEKSFSDRSVELPRLKESLGHKPSEVIAGGLLGISMAMILTVSTWTKHVVFITTYPSRGESLVYLVIWGLLVIATTATLLFYGRKLNQVPVVKKARSAFRLVFLSTSLVGIFFVVAQLEAIRGFAWRLWSLLLIVALILFSTYFYRHYLANFKQRYQLELETARHSRQIRRKQARRKKRH